MAENKSEVARLLAQISTTYEAAQRGLTGLASGTVRHTFINAKLERMSELHDSLRSLVGEQAIVLLAQELETIPDAAGVKKELSADERRADQSADSCLGLLSGGQGQQGQAR